MSKPLMIDEDKAKKIYPDAPAAFKKELETHFGKEVLLKKEKYFEKVASFEDAVKVLGITQAKLSRIIIDDPQDEEEEASNAWEQIRIIIRAVNFLNNNWKTDYSNSDQQKWYPWFEWEQSGFGFSHSHAGCGYTAAGVGVRLVLADNESADYVGRNFLEIWNKILSYKK